MRPKQQCPNGCPHAHVAKIGLPVATILGPLLLQLQHVPQAQRVIGCVARRSRSALTQRRNTTTRYSLVGNLLADLPSGGAFLVP